MFKSASRHFLFAFTTAIFCFGIVPLGAETRADLYRFAGSRLLPSSSELLRSQGQGQMSLDAPLNGALSLRRQAALDTHALKIDARLLIEDASSRVGIALAHPGQGWYLIQLSTAGVEISRSGGTWSDEGSAPEIAIDFGVWYSISLVLSEDESGRSWRIFLSPDSIDPQSTPALSLSETSDAVIGGLSPGVYGAGKGQIADLLIQSLSLPEGKALAPPEPWPLELRNGAPKLSKHLPAKINSSLSISELSRKVGRTVPGPSPKEGTPAKSASDFPCDPYQNHYVGNAPEYPGSFATLSLPPLDNDCDGSFDEDPWNWHDDDGDGLVDEDPGCWGDHLLNWHSEDSLLGVLGDGDVNAIILNVWTWWPHQHYLYFYAAPSPDGYLLGGARIEPLGNAEAIAIRGWNAVNYELRPRTEAPLNVDILQGGTLLSDGQYFTGCLSFEALDDGGAAPIVNQAQIDGSAYTLGETFCEEGWHSIHIDAEDAGGQSASVEKHFGIDSSGPVVTIDEPGPSCLSAGSLWELGGLYSDANPASGSAAVSLDITNSEGNTSAVLGNLGPDDRWSAHDINLGSLDGQATIALSAVDAYGNTSTLSRSLRIDATAPAIELLMDGQSFPNQYPGPNPPTGVEPSIFGRSITVSASATDPPFADTLSVALSLDGAPYSPGTTISAEGEHLLVAETTDCAAHQSLVGAYFLIDISDPDVSVFESGNPVSEPLLLGRAAIFTADASDATATTLSATIDQADYLLGTPFSEEGEHSLSVVATDEAGNTATFNLIFTIDLSPPEITVEDPAPGSVHEGPNIAISGRVSADTASLSSGGVAAELDPVSGDWRAFHFSSLPLDYEGDNQIDLSAVDEAGLTSVLSVNYQRDSRPPVLTIDAPLEGMITNQANLIVSGTVIDANLQSLRVGSQSVTPDAAGAFQTSLDLVEGSNTIEIEAVDILSHTSTLDRIVTLDTQAPVISLLVDGSGLEEGALFNHRIAVEISAEDATATEITAMLNGAAYTSATPIDGEGAYQISVDVTDAAGNTTNIQRHFRIDTTAPVISALVPADGAMLADAHPQLSGACDDALSLSVDGEPASITEGAFSYSGLNLSEGENTISLRAEDAAGNVTTTAHHLVLDTNAPVLNITSPSDGELVGSSDVQISGTVSETNLLTVKVAGHPASIAGENFQVRVPLSNEGANTINIEAADEAGNTTTLSLNLERDSLAPEISISAPGPSAVLSERSFEVSGLASDAHLSSVLVNSQPATLETDGRFSSTLALPEGRHPILFEATDSLNHRSQVEREVRIDLSAPEITISEPEAGALVGDSTVPVSGTVGEPEGIAHATLNGQELTIAPDGSFSGSLDLSEGTHDLIVRVVDEAGNTGVASISITVDTVPPELLRLIPSNGSEDVPANAVLRAEFSEAISTESLSAGISLLSSGSPVDIHLSQENSGATVVVTPEGGLQSDTEYSLQISTGLSDEAGHPVAAGAESTFRTLDGTAPEAPVVDQPPSPACFSTLHLEGSAEADCTISARGDIVAGSAEADDNGSFVLDLEPAISDGGLTISLVAEDSAGNASIPTLLNLDLDCEAPFVEDAHWDGDSTLSLRVSEILDPSTLIDGVSLILEDGVGALGFSHSLDGLTLSLHLDAPPQAGDLPLRVSLGAEITDPAGNALIPYTQLFDDPATATLIGGEVFSDRNSLEIPGARVILIEDGVPLPNEDVLISADGRGHFQLPVSSSPVAVRIEADGYLPSWRRIVPLPGASTLLFDTRLSPARPMQHVEDATEITAGAAQLTIPSGAIPAEGIDISLSPISGQGLPALLPLGWLPRAAAALSIGGDGLLVSPATLFLGNPPPDALIARFDVAQQAWIAESFDATIDVDSSGTWALLSPDEAPGLPGSPGVPVLGAVLPAADFQDPGELEASLSLDPPRIMPMETAQARVEVTTASAAPSGLPVEALLDEVLHTVNGAVLAAPPVDIDLVLYRKVDGTMEADFGLGATDAARQFALEEGSRRINIQALPPGLRTEDLVGPAGGNILTTEGLGLEIPAGALDVVTGISLDPVELGALPIALPEGLEAVAAALVDLGGAEFRIPAILSFPGAAEPDTQYFLLSPTEIEGETLWRFIGPAAKAADRIVSDPASAEELPAPWVGNSGLYLLVRPSTEDWGFVSGTVLDVGGLPVSAPCRVDATGGLVQLPDGQGRYALAAPAGAVDLLALNLGSRNLGGVEDLALSSAETLASIDIQILSTPPRVVGTSPSANASNLSATTPVHIDFSEAIDPTSTGNFSVSVVVGTSAAQEWAGDITLSTDGTRLSYEPEIPYPSASQVLVNIPGAIRDLQGYTLEGGDQSLVFGIERFLLPNDVNADRIRLYMPGHDADHPELPVVEGEVGALPGDVWIWVEDLSHDASTSTLQVQQDGSFSILLQAFDGVIGVEVGDRLQLHLLNSDSQDDDLGVIPLAPWLTEDGMGAYFTLDGASFSTVQHVEIGVAFGAYPDGGSVSATIIDPASMLTKPPSFSPPRGGISLEMSAAPLRSIALAIPGDTPDDPDSTMLIGRLIDVAGQMVPMLVATAHWDAEAQLYRTTDWDDLGEEPSKALARAAKTGVPDPILPGIGRSGIYIVFEPLLDAGAKADLAAGLAENTHLIFERTKPEMGAAGEGGPVEPGVRVEKVFLSDSLNVGFLNAVFSPVNAALLSTTVAGLEDADLVGGPWAQLWDEVINEGWFTNPYGFGATVPVRPDRDFKLQVLDGDTGYLYGEDSYPAPGTGTYDLDPSDTPGEGNAPLKIISADPFIILSFDAFVGSDVPLADGISYTMSGPDSGLTVSVSDGALPADRRIRLIDLKTGVLKSLNEAPGSLKFGAGIGLGDPMLFVAEGLIRRGDEEIVIRFNKSIDGNQLLKSDLDLAPSGDGDTPGDFRISTSGQTLRLSPKPAWQTGGRWNLQLGAALFSRLGRGQNGVTVSLPLKMADVPAGGPVLDGVTISDVAIEGDVMILARRNTGLSCYDISDPSSPKNLGFTSGLTGPSAVESDGFGHVFTVEGAVSQGIALRMYLLSDLADPNAGQVAFKASRTMNYAVSGIGPGDLKLEVSAHSIPFTAAAPGDDLTVDYDDPASPTAWTSLTVPADLMKAHHPVLLLDGYTGEILARSTALEEDQPLTIPNPGDISLDHPLILRTHLETIVWAVASGGALEADALNIDSGGFGLSVLAGESNASLLSFDQSPTDGEVCRSLGAADFVYLGRLGMPLRRDGKTVLLSATRLDGLWGFIQPDNQIDAHPDWLQCVRADLLGEQLNDVAATSWKIGEGQDAEEKTLVAVVGHRELVLYALKADQHLLQLPLVTKRLDWDPFRVAFDDENKLLLLRDNGVHLAVFNLDFSGASGVNLDLISDIILPDGSGMGPLVLEPGLGLAVAGNAPVQYIPPEIELVADADGDGLYEKVEYLQPLGAPMAPVVNGTHPPLEAYVRAKILGVPSKLNEITVKVEGLGPGGAAVPGHPAPFLPSIAEIKLHRTAGLSLDDPGRHTFISTRPILLIADERARTKIWKNLTSEEIQELTDEDSAGGRYAICRNCGRDPDGDGVDIPWGIAAPRPGETPDLEGVSADAPWEMAAAGRLRFTVVPPTNSTWLRSLASADQLPEGQVESIPWAPSPAVGAAPGASARAAALPEVDLATGGLELSRSDLSLPAPGMDISLGRDYTSAGIHYGLFGWGWEMAGLSRLRPNPDGTVDLYTASGERFVFGKSAGHPGATGDTMTAWGIPSELKREADGSWFLLAPDGSYTEYEACGYPTDTRDRHRLSDEKGSEIRYSWLPDGTLGSISQLNGKHSTDTHPRRLSFSYKVDTTQKSTGLIEEAVDSTGRSFEYEYDDYGRLKEARIRDVQLGGGTGDVVEHYEVETLSPQVADLEDGARIDQVKDAEDDVEIDVDWSDDGVEAVTRGSGADALKTSISYEGEGHWKITEGPATDNPTISEISLAPAKSGEQRIKTVTLGQGMDAVTSTSTIDRDGRVMESTDPAGIRTATTYRDDKRRWSFSPEIVSTSQGTVGESRPETPASLTTSYQYYPDSPFAQSITRPGPTGSLVTTYGRDGVKYPTSISGPDGRTTNRDIDDLGRVTGTHTSTGAHGTVSYDDLSGAGTGEVATTTSSSLAGTSSTRLVRNELGFVESSRTVVPAGVTDRVSLTTVRVNALGWTLSSSRGGSGHESLTQTTYDAAGRIASISSGGADGHQITTIPGYTSAGMIAGILRSEGAQTESTTMSYDSAGRLLTSTSAGLTTTYTYDSAGRTKTRAEGAMEPTRYDYDEAGRMRSTTSPGGKTETTVFDLLGRSVGRIDPSGLREDLSLAFDGRLITRKLLGPGGLIWAEEGYHYDALGRQTDRTVERFALPPVDGQSVEELTSHTEYYESGPQMGLVHRITDTLGRVTEFVYDDAGREIERDLPDGTVINSEYYADGKVSSRTVTGPGGWTETSSSTYDDQGRLESSTDPSGRTTRYIYDKLGRKITKMTDGSEVDPATGEEVSVTRLTSWDYGDLGRTVTETRPDGAQITKVFDERGNLVSYSDDDGNETAYAYDDHGRLATITYPDGTGKSFTYDPDGELETITRADGTVVEFGYDEAGRMRTATVAGTLDTSYDYDSVGHLESTANPSAALTFSWDSVGNQLSETLELLDPAFLGLGAKQLSRSFDLGNRPTTLSYPYPDVLGSLTRGFDDGNRLNSLSLGGTQLWHAEYDGGRTTKITRGNGLDTSYAYTADGMPSEILTGIPDAGGAISDPLHRLAFSWTTERLRRTKAREDVERMLYAFHYDEVGHLESLAHEPTRPAVRKNRPDLAIDNLPQPTEMTEDWQVNRVDELEKRDHTEAGSFNQVSFDHNDLHQVEHRNAADPVGYTWNMNGNLETRTGGRYGDAVFAHDWRDRLVGVQQGSVDTDIVVDPLGRMVGKVKHTSGGDLARAYIHDGDQVAVEYVQPAGGTTWQPERRHLWSTWIDQLAVEQVDTDGDGSLDKTLYPITDMLGSVQLLTDDAGKIVERIEYDPDGTPHFFSADTQAPAVTRVLWTGDGALPTGESIEAHAFELGFSEAMDPASMTNATATLTPEGGSAVNLSVTLGPDGRSAELTGGTIEAGSNYALHFEGMRDTSGNALQPEDRMLSVADPESFEVIADTSAPVLLAVMDGNDGIYLLFDEPVVVAGGGDLANAVTLTRQGVEVDGETTRVDAKVLKWTPTEGTTWLLGAQYALSGVSVEDLAGNPADAAAMSFTHLAGSEGQLLIARQAPTDSYPMAESAYGLTTLFQGRTWHSDLGLYYYRARWYLPDGGMFGARDPLGYVDSPSLSQFVGYNPIGHLDPLGERITIRMYTGRSKLEPSMLDLIQIYVADVFRQGFRWRSPDDVRVFRYSYSLLGVDSHPEATDLPPLPSGYEQVADLYLNPSYKDVPGAARKFASGYNFDFRAYVEMEGMDWAPKHAGEAAGHTQGLTFPSGGYSIVYERECWKGLAAMTVAGYWHRDKFLDAMYFAGVVAHELGHQFGLSPKDYSSFISGSGTMATRSRAAMQLRLVEKRLNEAKLRAKRNGIPLTPSEKERIWLKVFSFSTYDREWIRLLSDPNYGS